MVINFFLILRITRGMITNTILKRGINALMYRLTQQHWGGCNYLISKFTSSIPNTQIIIPKSSNTQIRVLVMAVAIVDMLFYFVFYLLKHITFGLQT